MTDDVWQSFATAGWQDLATNLPGDVVRRRADELAAQWQSRGRLTRLLTPRVTERRWRRGAEGEEIVGQRLSTLDVGWYLLNDIPLTDTGARIAHLLIGPGGVFVITPAVHRDKRVYVSGETTLVNGFRQYHTRTSRCLASRVAKDLTGSVGFDVDVRAVVAFVNVKELVVREQPRDGRVFVTSARGARRWIRQQPERLSPHAVERLFAMARRSTTWESSEQWLLESAATRE